MSDAEVIALLKRYKCPTPFHEVRTRFLGNIASPKMGASPMETVKQLWGGELPEFDSMEAVNEPLNVLVAGLWNRLTAHQSSRTPFWLTRFDAAQTREGLKHSRWFAGRNWTALSKACLGVRTILILLT